MSSTDQVHSLHLLAVHVTAQALASAVARSGGAQRVSADAIRSELGDLVEAANRLAEFERRAQARGQRLGAASGAEAAELVASSASALAATPEQLEALSADPNDLFEFAEMAEGARGTEDPFEENDP